jgi:hypothetical protein
MKPLLITAAAVLSLSANLTLAQEPPNATPSAPPQAERDRLRNRPPTGMETSGGCHRWPIVERHGSGARVSASRTGEPRSTCAAPTANRQRIARIFSCRCWTGWSEERLRTIPTLAKTAGTAHVIAEAGSDQMETRLVHVRTGSPQLWWRKARRDLSSRPQRPPSIKST